MGSIGKPLLTESLTRAEYLQNHVEDWGQLCRHLGEEWRPEFPWLAKLPSHLPNDLTDFIKKHQELGPVGIVHCGARGEARRWPVDRFRMLLEKLFLPRNLPVILIDLPDLTIPDLQNPLIRTYRPESLASYVALCGLTDYALCNDTGSAHLAGATGKPVVTIFTNNRPEWFAPYGNQPLAVEGADCPYKPCLERCVMPSYICRDGVTVEAVEEKLIQCLSLIGLSAPARS
jgi:ADP-heptose:LPS heptosyltransferase